MLYFMTPFHKTGGPENTHLTSSIINRICGKEVSMVIYITPCPPNTSLYPEIDNLRIGTIADVEDIPTNFIILPEIYHVERIRRETGFIHCYYIVWWQSYINASINFALTNYHVPGVMHAFHSYYEYAMVRPHLNASQRFFLLTDFIADEFTTIDTDALLDDKEAFVCFNGHKDMMSRKILEEAKVPFIEIKEMSRDKVIETLKKCRVYIDMGTHPGKDHMPREAAMCGCVVVTNKSGSAAYQEDVAIEEKVVFEEDLVPLVQTILKSYPQYYKKQETYRRIIRGEKDIATKNIVNFLKIHNTIVDVHEGISYVSRHDYTRVIQQHENILKRLEEICIEHVGSVAVEGNCFCEHQNIQNRLPELIPKQMNLFSLGIHASQIVEIGFNAGHSALLFLLANPSSVVTCFDICHHAYTKKCFEFLSSIFPGRLQLIIGDSTITVPQYFLENPEASFDLFHLDGSHELRIVKLDFENTLPMVKDVIIFDDTQDEGLNHLLDTFIDAGTVYELPMYKTKNYEHRIVRKRVKARTLTV